MSVQAGVWNFDGQAVECQQLTRMAVATALDTEAGETVHLDSNVGLIYRAVHTTLESIPEQQPHAFAGGKVLTWDGRLDNREELMPHLHDKVQQLLTDLQIVVASYERWGSDCFARFRGDWAISIWDRRHNELILARDYIGVRQLFYRATPHKISWCSNLSALTSADCSLTLCDEYVANYLALRFDGHLTPYSEIRAVPPGSTVRIRDGSIRVDRYWTFAPRSRTRYKTDADYEEHFLHLFRQAVECRLRANGTVIADLSGGLDSSSIVCMADSISKGGAIRPLDTFSYNYCDEPDGNDMFYIKAVEQMRGQVGHHLNIWNNGESFSLDYPTPLPSPILGARREVEDAHAKFIADGGHRISLSGFGGDEFLGQALEARVAMADRAAQLQLVSFGRELMAWSLFWRRPVVPILFDTLGMLLPASLRRRLVSTTSHPAPWLNADFAESHGIAGARLAASEGGWWWLPSARDWFQTRVRIAGILTNLHPSGDEKRYPYLDQTLTEFLASVPVEQLLRPGDRRSLMRRALKELLPLEVLSRRSKQQESRGYVITVRKHWKRVQAILDAPLISELGYVRGPEFRSAFVTFAAGLVSKESMMLLRGLFLELWIRSALEHNILTTRGKRCGQFNKAAKPSVFDLSASRSA